MMPGDMRGPWGRVTPGTPWRPPHAQAWNAILDVAQQHQLRTGGDEILFPRNSTMLRVSNRSGMDVPLFGVLAIRMTGSGSGWSSGSGWGSEANAWSEPIIHSADDVREFWRVMLHGTAPQSPQDIICITLQPLPTADPPTITSAVLAGAIPTKVRIRDKGHTAAVPVPGIVDYLDTSASGNIAILWRAEGAIDEIVWAYVLLGGQTATNGFWARLTAKVVPPGIPPAEYTRYDAVPVLPIAGLPPLSWPPLGSGSGMLAYEVTDTDLPVLPPHAGEVGASSPSYPPPVVWMRSLQWASGSSSGTYVFGEQPRWEDIEITSTQKVVIGGKEYYQGAVVRYDQVNRVWCRKTPCLVRFASDSPAGEC